MCNVSSLYGDQAMIGLLKSCKGWGKMLWEIQFEFKIQIYMDHSNRPDSTQYGNKNLTVVGSFKKLPNNI